MLVPVVDEPAQRRVVKRRLPLFLLSFLPLLLPHLGLVVDVAPGGGGGEGGELTAAAFRPCLASVALVLAAVAYHPLALAGRAGLEGAVRRRQHRRGRAGFAILARPLARRRRRRRGRHVLFGPPPLFRRLVLMLCLRHNFPPLAGRGRHRARRGGRQEEATHGGLPLFLVPCRMASPMEVSG